MAERRGSRSRLDSDTASVNEWAWEDTSTASSEPTAGSGSDIVSAAPSQARSGRINSKLPLEAERALVKVLLDPVLRGERPEVAYKGLEDLLGEPGSQRRKTVDNRRRYIVKNFTNTKFADLVAALGLSQRPPSVIDAQSTHPTPENRRTKASTTNHSEAARMSYALSSPSPSRGRREQSGTTFDRARGDGIIASLFNNLTQPCSQLFERLN
jgi:hypothetical protein